MIRPFLLESHLRKLALAGLPGEIGTVIRRIVESQHETTQPASRSMPSLECSAKMGNKICPTGSNIELEFQLVRGEWDDGVAGYVTQVENFNVTWTNLDGSKDSANHKPDFLLIPVVPSAPAPDWVPATFCEIKHSSELTARVKLGDGRYIFDMTTGRWRSPAAEKAAKEIYSLGYEVVTEADIDHLQAGNVDYVYDFIKKQPPKVPLEVIESVQAYVAMNQGTTIADLLLEVGGLPMDRFLAMVVRGQLFVPMDEDDLRATDKVRVYSDNVVADAHRMMLRTQNNGMALARPPLLQTGEQLQMDQVIYDVLDGSGEVVRLRDEALGIKSIKRVQLFRMHRDGRLHSLGIPSDKEKKVREILRSATSEQLLAAMERLHPIESYITSDKRRAAPGEPKLSPTDRYWLNKGREAFAEHGNALAGCIDRISQRGGRKKKVCGARQEVIDTAIKEYFLIPIPKSKGSVYSAYKALCKKEKVGHVSYKTFAARLKAIPPDQVALKREGEMASGQHAPPCTDEQSLAAKAKYFMHVVQMDEYVFDVATIDPELGRCLGQFWVVVMLDVYTRTVLAIFASFEEPSYALTTLPTLRKCVQRWKRCPRCILTDRGAGFREGYARAAVSMGVRPTWRPAGKGRGAPQVERCGGVSNQRIASELQGCTAIFAKYRRVSDTHDSAKLAIHFTAELIGVLENYFYEVYDQLPHGGLNNRSPRAMREMSRERDGERKHLTIEPDSVFEILSLPGPTRGDGTAKVQEHDGIQQDGLYYWHNKFGMSEFIGTRVQMRWDPCDITHVFAYIGGKWEECVCLKLREFSRLPREQLCLTSIMIRSDRKKYKRSAAESIDAIQTLLNKVRKTEAEVTEVLRMRESAKMLTLTLPPVCLSSEPTSATSVKRSTPAGLPTSYLGEKL